MNTGQKSYRSIFFMALALVVVSSCRTIAIFDNASFQRTSVLKARVLVLIDHADEPYEKYNNQIDSMLVESQTIYAMQKAREKNENTAKQWELMLDDKKGILTGFFNRWKIKKTLSITLIEEAKPKIATGFDEILKLESAKLKY